MPHPVDVHVGNRLRTRRTMLGMTQETLGDSVGVTFQQIQKYERGLNRIGSSRLYEFACILGIPVAYFFDDYKENTDPGSSSTSSAGRGFPNKEYEKFGNEVLGLVRAYYDIEEPLVRKRVLALVKSLSTSDAKREEVAITE